MITLDQAISNDNENSNIEHNEIDFNIEHKLNQYSKSFLEKTIKKVLSKINENPKRLSVNKISLDHFDSTFKGIRFSKKMDADELKNNKRISVNNIQLNEFDFAFKGIRFSKKIEIDQYKNEKRISMNNIKLNDFDSAFKGIRFSNKIDIDDVKNMNKEVNSKETLDNESSKEKFEISNENNQCNKFTKDFLSDKVRKTITSLSVENISGANNDNFNNNCNEFSKDFFNQKVRKTITKIETEPKKEVLENQNYNCNEFSENFLKDKFRNTINKIEKQEELSNEDNTANQANNNINDNYALTNKKNSIVTSTGSFINESIKRLSSTIDEMVKKKNEAEKLRKSELIEKETLNEKLQIEKEIEISKINNFSNNFWRKSCTDTLQKYKDERQEKLVKYVIRIQKNFRRHLWMFIIKLEMMNLQIQKENERAIAASKKRKSVSSKSN